MNVMARLQRLPSPAHLAARLDARRTAAVDSVLSSHAALVAEARGAFATLSVGRDVHAERVVERAARTLLGALRDVGDAYDRALRTARWIDGALHTERRELLDRDDVPTVVKRITMRMLHAVNVAVDAYAIWAEALDEALGALETAHVYDLAAGTGGFARHLAEAPIAGRRLTLTSSDLEPGYVAMGARIAQQKRLDVRFEVRDVLDLRAVAGVDIFVCTQATHHLTPGQVVQLIAGAVERAPRGILIVDLQRSLVNLALTGGFLAAFALPLLHDGLLSVRRSYARSELLLLARLAGARSVSTAAPSATFSAVHAMGPPLA